MFILVDIDHTLSNAFWRNSMIGVEAWDDYHAASIKDKPFIKMIRLINRLNYVGYTIIALTGRTEKFRKLTIEWLVYNEVDINEILMRPDDCFIKNAAMKIQLIKQRFDGIYKNIHFLIDDNEDTCIAFSELGITTLQVRNIA